MSAAGGLTGRDDIPTTDPEKWLKLQNVFEAALKRPVSERHSFVAEECRQSPDLIPELEELLAAFAEGEDELEDSPVARAMARDSRRDVATDAIPGYRIERELHRGGQGVVYQAVQLSTKRTVALKVMLDGPFSGASSRRRFEREIEFIGSLKHPGIVPVFDSGVAHDKHYFAMEYVNGERLSDHMLGHDFSTREKLELFIQICQAVDYAHQKRVIHRDLKPSNILIDERGQPRIVDFGLAKSGVANSKKTAVISVTGQVMGTPNYMSPEQSAGRVDEVDVRSDVYSLGVVLFEMLTGTLPFADHSTIPDHLAAGEVPEPRFERSLNSSIDGEVRTILLKGISAEKERRYHSVAAFADDIGRYLIGDPISAKRDSTWYVLRKMLRRHSVAALVALSFLVVVVCSSVVGWSLFWKADRARTKADIASQNLEIQRDAAEKLRKIGRKQLYNAQMNLAGRGLMDFGGIARVGELTDAWIPVDGEEDFRNWEWYYLRSRCGLESAQVQTEDWVFAARFSPDGKWIAAGNGTGGLTIRPTDDLTNYREVCRHAFHIRGLAWSHDGRWLASSSPGMNVIVVDPVSGIRKATYKFEEHVLAVAWHPNQPLLAAGDVNGQLGIWNMETGEKLSAKPADSGIQTLDWSPDGSSLAIGTHDSKVEIRRATAGSYPTINVLTHSDPVFCVQFSPDSKYLATCDTGGSVTKWDAKAIDPSMVWSTTTPRPMWDLAWSPDGKHIASVGEDRLIRIRDGRRGDLVSRLEGHTAAIWAVDWSADGRTLVTGSNDNSIRTWSANAAQQDRVAIAQPIRRPGLDSVVWHPHEQLIAIGGHAYRVFLLASETGEITSELLAGGRSGHVAWNSDGSQLAMSCMDRLMIWNMQNPESPTVYRIDSSSSHEPAFSPDGKYVAVPCHDMKTIIFELESGDILKTWSAPRIHYSANWHPQGELLAIATGQSAVVLNVRTDQVRTLAVEPGQCIAIRFSPDGDRVAVANENGSIFICNPFNGRCDGVLRDHTGPVRCLAWHPDGERLASGSGDTSVRIWDVASETQVLMLDGHDSEVNGVAWSPDGRQLVSVSRDSRTCFWDARRGYAMSDSETFGRSSGLADSAEVVAE